MRVVEAIKCVPRAVAAVLEGVAAFALLHLPLIVISVVYLHFHADEPRGLPAWAFLAVVWLGFAAAFVWGIWTGNGEAWVSTVLQFAVAVLLVVRAAYQWAKDYVLALVD